MTARWWLFPLVALLAACNGEDTDTEDTEDTEDSDTEDTADNANAVVRVTGGAFLEVGQVLALTASTVDGTDDGYTWASSDAVSASVDASGVVTGIRAADITITATGTTSGKSGTLQIAVRHTVPNEEEWAGSGHADFGDEPFQHFADDDSVSANCARCHTTTGYRDYIGDDGTTVDLVDGPHPPGQVVSCEACHNETTPTLSHVVFPSGKVVDDLGREAICMTCHQGRASGKTIDDKIAAAQAAGTEPPGDDVVDADLGFTDIHYYAAGATIQGSAASGGYEYEGLMYDSRFRHVPERENCIGCHDQHTLQLRLDACAGCHTGVASYDDIKDVRMIASQGSDYDGDGDLSEGLYYEVVGQKERLYRAIQTYATEHANAAAICFDPSTNPNWFIDTDGDGGPCEAGEAVSANKYVTWTPRLLQAAYNYQVGTKDPGAFAHNGKYILELLYDSIVDLNLATNTDIDLSHSDRTDPGHFNGASDAFRHWDEDEEISTSCSRCHGGNDGFSFFVEHGVSVLVPETANGLACATCHPDDWNYDPMSPETVLVPSVKFPSNVVLPVDAFFAPADAICSTCHAGRESKATIDAVTGVAQKFKNIHYLPAAATFYGTEAKVGYQYTGKTYSGPWTHPPGASCTYCHSPAGTDHSFAVEDTMALCSACHLSASEPGEIRLGTFDYDGDGNVSETLAAELSSFREAALVAINAYATGLGKPAICYDPTRSPYWFKDTGTLNVHCGPEDTVGYATGTSTPTVGWDKPMVAAAFNVHMSVNDTGAWAHNIDYMTQLLYDSILSLSQPVGTLQRPAP